MSLLSSSPASMCLYCPMAQPEGRIIHWDHTRSTWTSPMVQAEGCPMRSGPGWQVPRTAVARWQCLRDPVESRRLLKLADSTIVF